MAAYSLKEIVDRLGGELRGDGELRISGISTLAHAQAHQAAFLANSKYVKLLPETLAGVVVLNAEHASVRSGAVIISPRPYLYFAHLSQLLNPRATPDLGIHPSAVSSSPVPDSASIGPLVTLGRNVKVGEGVIIGAGCHIGNDVEIGDHSILYPGVVIYDRCTVGSRAIIHGGAVIGADGFGFARDEDGSWVKIPQIGAVRIGNDVEIGANTTIDRGALEDTLIGDGVKLDNQIQVAHNVVIGDHTAIAGCVGIAGSAVIGERCTVGGAANVLGHLRLADGVNVSSGSLVAKSIPKPGTYTGSVPFMPHDEWLQNFSKIRHLDSMTDKIRALEARIAELEKKS